MTTRLSLAAALALAPLVVAADSPLTAGAVAGKTLRAANGDAIVAQADGTLRGKVGPDQSVDLLGEWSVRDGRWCRTLTAPAAAAGSACQDAALNDDGTLTIHGRNGPVVWTLE